MASVPLLSAKSSKNGRKKLKKVRIDRISNLPPDVTEYILQCLPLKDAVKMNILSTHWRYRWVFLPQLILDAHFFSAFLKFTPRCRFDEVCDHDGDCEIPYHLVPHSELDRVLLHHVGPIRKFVLFIPHWLPIGDEVSSWIQFVSGKFVQEFTLYHEWKIISGRHPIKLPSFMFYSVGFYDLTHLTVTDCSLSSLPHTFRGFSNLVCLVLHSNYVSEGEANKLEILVSKSLLLETLDLDIHEDSCLSIRASRLQNLILVGELSSICLEAKTNTIKNLTLDITLMNKTDLFVKLFAWFPCVEKLTLVAEDFLRKLRFEESPRSRTVEEDCLHFKYLRDAKISGLSTDSNTRIMLQLIRMILLYSPVLEALIIEATIPDAEKLNIAAELLQYRRASTNAKIIFKI